MRLRRHGRAGPSSDGRGGEGRLTGLGRRFLGPQGRWARTAVIVLLCFVVGYVVAGRWVFPSAEGAPDAPSVRVPDLRAATVDEARARMPARDVEVRVRTRIHHPEADSGTIVAQSPLGGQLVAAGDTVFLTVSRGPDRRVVPDLVGLSARQAGLVLGKLGFEVETEVVPSGAGPAGVQGTRPAAGEQVVVPSRVRLLVGEGPQIALVPSLRGLHIDDVEARLEEAGLQLGTVRFDADARAAAGRVIAQSPPAGYSLRGGGVVSVEVAGRPGEVEAGEAVEGVLESDTTGAGERGPGGDLPTGDGRGAG